MAKNDGITPAPTPPALELDAHEINLILAYRAMDEVHQSHMSKLSVALAEHAPRRVKPALRLIGGGTE